MRFSARTKGRRRTRILAAVAAATLAAAGVLAVRLTREGGSGAPVAAGHRASAARTASTPDIPVVPVAVLNATATQGAAKALAAELQKQAIKVAAVGNLGESRRAGLWILYAHGERTQAARVARLLARRAPMIAPIDPAAQAAAGRAAPIVVVIA